MNIALIGYGRMGREVEAVARERGITIAAVFDAANNASSTGLTRESLHGVDVCLEFSTPKTVLENIIAVAAAGKNIVVGTTGWQHQLDQVRKIVKEKKTGFLHSPNFSLGVNLLLQMVMDAAHLIDRYPEYDVAIQEVHHRGKADNPSGTALSLGSVILQTMGRKSELVTDLKRGPLQSNQVHVSSTRVGAMAGRHAVVFDSDCDTLELVHTAKSRRGLALGALVAAEWLKGKKGFYTMRDVLLT